mgnify:CR=1 FL=1|tara:strand:- start:108 stop:263 length:156 start_codon:yes stop_codon:yes gene_type:complete
MKNFTKSEIIKSLTKLFNDAQFYVTKEGHLTMSLDGKFVDHTWTSGTYINM